jgi:hypothetical protein
MSKKTLTRGTLETILDDAGLDAEDVVYNWPSGMYGGYGGHRSFALTIDLADLAKFFKALGSLVEEAQRGEFEFPEGTAVMGDFLPSGSDPLGHGSVTYFRGWELEPEE